MLNRLAIAVFGIAFLFANSQNECRAKHKQNSKDGPSAPVTIVDNSTRQSEQNHPSQSTPESHAGIEWSNWVIAGIAFLTGLAIWIQARDTRLAAQATQESAETASRQLDSIVASERAWVVIEAAREDSVVTFRAVNVGKTPAEVISIHGRVQPIGQGNTMSEINWEELDESLISTPPCFLPPTVSCAAFDIDLEKLFGAPEDAHYSLKMGMHEFVFYGKVRYYDILRSVQKEVHETKWRYRMLPYKAGPPIPDPRHPECNSHT